MTMKTINFQGNTYNVPDWAKYVTQDTAGLIEVHESKPKHYFDDSSGTSIWSSYGETVQLNWPSLICEQLP